MTSLARCIAQRSFHNPSFLFLRTIFLLLLDAKHKNLNWTFLRVEPSELPEVSPREDASTFCCRTAYDVPTGI